jgi:outer membrane immunogenic protein
MRKLILTIFTTFSSIFLFAQSPIHVGQAQINAGIGLSSYGIPIYVGFDYGVHPDITVGAELSYRSFHEDYYGYRFRHSVVGLLANGNYHFNRILKIPSPWDLYAGLNLGFYSWKTDGDYHGNHNSGVGLGIQLGGRYYFNNKVGINLEIAAGNTVADGKFGVSVRL